MKPSDLAKLRARLRLTQRALAERIGAHPNTVARMERGELAISRRTEVVLKLLR